MKSATINYLNQINRDFYRITAVEFDATRGRAWPGWLRLLDDIPLPLSSVLDIGCGNGRFATFITQNQTASFSYCGIDNSAELLALARCHLKALPQARAELIEHDLILAGLPDLQAQLVVAFGLLHHMPGFVQRQRLLSSLADCVLPGGYLAIAAWRFYEEERFRRRIVAWNADDEVEKGDYLLDWRRGERALRYCHYIDDEEHAQLIAATGLSVIADFRADGASGNLNRYTLLRKRRAGG